MSGYDPYVLKTIEYLLGIGFLLCFALFWRFVLGGREAPAPAPARRRIPLPTADLFRVPADVMFHPGHAWARVEAPDLVSVGMDDFAQQLVGPIEKIALPQVGAAIEQGARAWRLGADSKAVDVLSPITGRVAAVNPRVLEDPRIVNEDPFGNGWLIKVQTPRLVTGSKQLLAGPAAKRWTECGWDELSSLFAPHLGTIMHDGGVPLHGLARGVDPEHWDVVARRFLLT